VACSSSETTAPVQDQVSTAEVLDQFSRAANARGDLPTGIVLGEAARAARFGVEPTVIPISFGDASLRYRAFVVVAALPAMGPLPATSIRSLVAVTGEGESAKVLMVATPANAATIVGPSAPGATRPDPFTSAMAVYGDGPKGARWIGIGGSVRIVEETTGAACPTAPPRGTCTTATYAVLMDGQFTPMSGRDATRSLSLARAVVNAVKLAP
jgi:hypothetical protein